MQDQVSSRSFQDEKEGSIEDFHDWKPSEVNLCNVSQNTVRIILCAHMCSKVQAPVARLSKKCLSDSSFHFSEPESSQHSLVRMRTQMRSWCTYWT